MLRRLPLHLLVRPRLLTAIAVGIGAGWLLPDTLDSAGRALVAWNIAVWLYLALVGTMMLQPDHGLLRRQAAAHAESAVVVLILAAAAAVASLVAIFVELRGVKAAGTLIHWQPLTLTLATISGAWLLLPFEFALTYASRYYPGADGEADPGADGAADPGADGTVGGGLNFPHASGSDAPAPNYAEFLYFSFTIAATAQTSDVAVTTRAMRRLVLAHAVLSFAFNTLVLALAINIVASLF